MSRIGEAFRNTPPVTKNLIVANVAIWLLSLTIASISPIKIYQLLGLHPLSSPYFFPWQIVTHMFMHDMSRIFHILFNMWALWMFGRMLESVWGSRRFLIFYLVTGLGAAAFHLLVNYIQFAPEIAQMKAAGGGRISTDIVNYVFEGDTQRMIACKRSLITPTVGASGAVYGVLLGFGMLFPNTQLFIIPFPFPIKAKWLVIGVGVIEIVTGITGSSDGIAHFAHLGGMIFGFILIKYWNRFTRNFY